MIDFKYNLTNKQLLDICEDLSTLFNAINECQSRLSSNCNNLLKNKDEKWVEVADTCDHLEEAKDLIDSLWPYLDEEYASDYKEENNG